MKLLLFLLALAAITSAAVYRTHLKKIENSRQRLVRTGKWQEHVKARRILRNKGIGYQPLEDIGDSLYIGEMYVGTPGQLIHVLIDTTSSLTFAFDKSCNCTNHFFDSSKSSTYRPLGGSFVINRSPLLANGTTAIDVITLGGLQISDQVFGQAKTGSGFFNADGILGLAFPYQTGDPINPVMNAFNQGLLDSPVFTIWMRRSGETAEKQGGMVTYGGLDPEHCSSDIVYQPLSAAMQWQFRLKQVSAGSYLNSRGWDAVVNSLDSFIFGPPAAVYVIAEQLGAKMNYDFGMYLLDNCETPPKYPVQFVIGVNTYTIQPENLIFEMNAEDGSMICGLSVQMMDNGGFGPQWYFGDPLTRQYCITHDIGRQRIGFALAKSIN